MAGDNQARPQAQSPTEDRRLVGGRYELQQLLKTGNSVRTYQAVDTRSAAPVIVKAVVASEVPTVVRLRLEHEIDVLEQISAPGFRPIIASGHDGELLYLVQPRIAGQTLRSLLDLGPLPVDDGLTVALGVLDRLELVHDAGVLHRDIKPANVVVEGDGCIEGAELIDFGLAWSSALDEPLRDDTVGTPCYLAPEASGVINAVVDQRSDLYSFGVLLFESLCGHVPFSGATVGEILRHHLNTPVPQLRSLGVQAPAALDGVVQRLLAKDPGSRYQTAAAVRADLIAIAEALSAGIAEPAVTPGQYDRWHALTEPSFVGRVPELATMTEMLSATAAGRGGGLVLLEAESGAGKTRFLDEIAMQASQRNFLVLRGEGVDQVAQRPFQLFDGVVAGLVAQDDGELAIRLRRRLDDRAASVASALPGLRGVLGVSDEATVGPEQYGSARSVDALSSMVEALGDATTPAVVLLDDCQWADGLTLSLVAHWQTRHGASKAPNPVLVVAAYRSEEVGPTHPLRVLDAAGVVALPPLGEHEIELLCTSMAGPLPHQALSAVVKLSGGSPFMAGAVLRGLVESGGLLASETGWEVDETALHDAQTSRRAAVVLARRFELMSPGAKALLTAGAVLGKAFDVTLAITLMGESPVTEVTRSLDDARRRQILWVDEQSGRCSFTHDKLRETLIDQIPADARRRLHSLAAHLIETTDPGRVFELAYHFDAAGEPQNALRYALEAADRARSRYALDVAISHYQIARRSVGAPSTDDARLDVQCRTATGLADVLTLAGDYNTASALFEEVLAVATGPVERAELHGKLGDIAFKRGDQLMARRFLEGALADLGRRVPTEGVVGFLALLKEVVVQALHTLMPRRFLGRRSPEGHEEEFVAIRLYSRLAYIYWFCAGKVPCAWTHLREMNLVERYWPTLELAQAYSEHAPVMTMVPWYSRGLEYAERSLAIRRELGDVWGQGQSLSFCGVVLYAWSRYRECIDRCREAIRLLERTGDRWEQNTATWHLVLCHYRLGELDQAAALAPLVYESASAIGDQAAAGIVLSGWARATNGQVPAEAVATELRRDTGDAHTSTEVRLADALRWLRSGQVEQALSQLEAAAEVIAGKGLRQEYMAPVKPWTATTLRMQAEATDPHAPWTRRRRLRRAARFALGADVLSRSYRNNRPHALRERGIVANLRGRPRRARRLLEKSLVVATTQHAAYEMAMTQVALAELMVALGREGASDQLARAEAEKAALEVSRQEPERSSLSLADRFDSLLVVARQIGAATTPTAVYDAVREAASVLLRGDRCHVIGDIQLGMLMSDPGQRLTDLSRDLVLRAVEGKCVVTTGAMSTTDSSESLVLSDLRSVLCAPIVCEDQVVAVFSVTHHRLENLFGPVEIQLAELIATLAGASLDHLAGSEARFRTLAQDSTDVITVVGLDGRISYQSAGVEQVFGYRPDELVGTPIASWVHPEDAAGLLPLIGTRSGVDQPMCLVRARLRRRDGRWLHGESAVRCLFDQPGVLGMVLNTRDVSERVKLETQLRTMALHDPLTGLGNRLLFVDRLEHALARHARECAPVAVAFLDVDDFKSINDTLGHHAGDLLLREVGARLQRCLRSGDTVARFGGDEFAILLEDCDRELAEATARRIVTDLERPIEVLGRPLHSRVSVGIAVRDNVESSDELLARADAAMYEAKNQGKSRYAVYEPDLGRRVVERSGMRTDLEWAVQRGELAVEYQPVVALDDASVRGFEALVRWDHPTRGRLAPDRFIALAEESGAITALGGWVLERACRQGASWRRTTGRPLTIAVNVSARQLRDPDLLHVVARALERADLEPEALVLEITESATVSDSEHVGVNLKALERLGVKLAVDDFGTGYSSLSYLRRFALDQLKIDRSFTAGINKSTSDRAIVATVIGLAHALGIEVVAEGVETEAQRDCLASLECDMAQGFIWTPPRPAEDLSEWLAAPVVARHF